MDVARRQVSDGEPGAAPRSASGAVTWRLVGANNHELGRSPHVFSDLTACGTAVERLQGGSESLTELVTMSSGISSGAWTWQLALEEDCVAVAVRGFRRQRECRHSLQLFLSAAAVAEVATAITYTRRLRGLRLTAGGAPGPAVRGGGAR
ncbi:hypothetical protein [Streptomyces sp. NPDC058613]|uniref:hypothetical protein n=1 Tax=unclassified Streptomyces TaxID=2593676 RepID=UPI003661CD32